MLKGTAARTKTDAVEISEDTESRTEMIKVAEFTGESTDVIAENTTLMKVTVEAFTVEAETKLSKGVEKL